MESQAALVAKLSAAFDLYGHCQQRLGWCEQSVSTQPIQRWMYFIYSPSLCCARALRFPVFGLAPPLWRSGRPRARRMTFCGVSLAWKPSFRVARLKTLCHSEGVNSCEPMRVVSIMSTYYLVRPVGRRVPKGWLANNTEIPPASCFHWRDFFYSPYSAGSTTLRLMQIPKGSNNRADVSISSLVPYGNVRDSISP